MSPGEALNDASSINDSPWPSLPPWGVWYTDAGSVNVMVTVELGRGGVTREPELKNVTTEFEFQLLSPSSTRRALSRKDDDAAPLGVGRYETSGLRAVMNLSASRLTFTHGSALMHSNQLVSSFS